MADHTLSSSAADVLRSIGEGGRIIQEFLELGAKAKAAAAEAMDAETALGDIPDEFLDPIQYTLMKDPVILPSSRVTVDRPKNFTAANRTALITLAPSPCEQLSWFRTDPSSRSHLPLDMLIPDNELKARIKEFIRTQAPKRDEGSANLHSTKGTTQSYRLSHLT
ncbi:hypothetical protein Cgig2_025822 [Carnegiea gigantea]|uniref:U-box domain-containing protein n=1 Tax=Carnegiea gigantea TaxID=171969 RepID=A0A9Q1JLA3_9CARY|nr:hypothetical protein Cgig2_025822 [Carnegiea gigantea]